MDRPERRAVFAVRHAAIRIQQFHERRITFGSRRKILFGNSPHCERHRMLEREIPWSERKVYSVRDGKLVRLSADFVQGAKRRLLAGLYLDGNPFGAHCLVRARLDVEPRNLDGRNLDGSGADRPYAPRKPLGCGKGFRFEGRFVQTERTSFERRRDRRGVDHRRIRRPGKLEREQKRISGHAHVRVHGRGRSEISCHRTAEGNRTSRIGRSDDNQFDGAGLEFGSLRDHPEEIGAHGNLSRNRAKTFHSCRIALHGNFRHIPPCDSAVRANLLAFHLQTMPFRNEIGGKRRSGAFRQENGYGRLSLFGDHHIRGRYGQFHARNKRPENGRQRRNEQCRDPRHWITTTETSPRAPAARVFTAAGNAAAFVGDDVSAKPLSWESASRSRASR